MCVGKNIFPIGMGLVPAKHYEFIAKSYEKKFVH